MINACWKFLYRPDQLSFILIQTIIKISMAAVDTECSIVVAMAEKRCSHKVK